SGLDAEAGRSYKNGLIGNHLAEAALEQAIREIVADAPLVVEADDGLLTFYTADGRAWPGLKREKSELGGAQCTYRITDEEPRININASTPDRIERLLLSLDLDKNVRDTIGDSIQDWRDAHEQHTLNGAQR